MTDMIERLAEWLTAQIPDATDLRIDDVDRAQLGFSAETMLAMIRWNSGGAEQSQRVVVRLRPPAPGLLEPYDLARQFAILRALEATPVRAPRALWFESTGTVLGREFYVMEFTEGTAYEQVGPETIGGSPADVRRMCESMVDQLAAIHSVDVLSAGLDALGGGTDHVQHELDHWAGEIDRVRRGPLPALDRLVEQLRATMPTHRSVPTLVHGDAKPGNFAFVGADVTAVFDWEMSTVGEPLTDVAWAEVNWTLPGSFTGFAGALSVEEFLDRYQSQTGIEVRDRHWHRGLQWLKMSTIMLVGAMLFDAGHTDDLRLGSMGMAVPFITRFGLADLGLPDEADHGPVEARAERFDEVRHGG